MAVATERSVLWTAATFLILCIIVMAALYAFAPSGANLKVELWKSLFDKVALGGTLAAFALLVGWWMDAVKIRRTFFLNQQLVASSEILARAARLADAASDWLYYDAPDFPKMGAQTRYGKAFAREIEAFGKGFDTGQPLLPRELVTALSGFHQLVLEPYYLFRDAVESPLDRLGHSNLDCAEFVGAAKRSLAIEFQIAVGISIEKPEIDLTARALPNFAEALSRWQEVGRSAA